MRYEIRKLKSDNYDQDCVGEAVAFFNNEQEACEVADKIAGEYYYGVAVYDIHTGMADFGDDSIFVGFDLD